MSEQKVGFKKRIFEIIQIGNRKDRPSRLFDFALVIAIIVNISVLFLETFDSLSRFQPLFDILEMITIAFFVVEYILRIWTADQLYPSATKGEAIRKFVFSYDGIVELLTILPYYYLSGFVVFRMLRVVRIFHLFRINANYDSFNVIISVLYEKRNQILSSLFIVIVLMFAASLTMYSCEHYAQPDKFENAFSGLWWSVSALLTVGYGDIYPITTLGKIMAIVISFLGVMAVAIPTGIISAGFVEQYQKASNSAIALESSIHTVIVDMDSNWLGKNKKQVERESKMNIVMVQHNDATFVPADDYTIEMKDVLVVYQEES